MLNMDNIIPAQHERVMLLLSILAYSTNDLTLGFDFDEYSNIFVFEKGYKLCLRVDKQTQFCRPETSVCYLNAPS